MLLRAVPGIDGEKARANLRFLARQHQDPDAEFPLITDEAGMRFILERVQKGQLDLVVLDNFSTLGEVEDENAASSFGAIQQFLLRLKTAGVATMLVHHANKGGENFRGSSKLAATFETIIHLERPKENEERGEAQFRVCWDKVRAGGPKKRTQPILAKLTTLPPSTFGGPEETVWEFEAADLSRLEDIKGRLEKGEFAFLREIADLYGLSKPMGRKYVERGARLGLWTEDEVSRWIGRGLTLRKDKKTSPPIRPSATAGLWDEEEGQSEEPPEF